MIFNKLIHEKITPFLKSKNFNLVDESKDYLKFKSKDLVIIFTYNLNPPLEIDMDFQFNEDSINYNFAFIKDYFGYKVRTLYAEQSREYSSTLEWVEQVKQFLSRHLDDILSRLNIISKDLFIIRNQRLLEEYNLKKESYVFGLINKAWKQKDYNSIVQIVEKHEVKLKGSIKKKYEYALKKLS